jgi:hypothetical protein
MNKKRLYQRLCMNKKGPIPEVVDEKKTPMLCIGLFLFIHNLWYGSLLIHPQPLHRSLFINPQPFS